MSHTTTSSDCLPATKVTTKSTTEDGLGDDDIAKMIAESRAANGMSDCDCFIAWHLGVAAFKAVRQFGARFPHNS